MGIIAEYHITGDMAQRMVFGVINSYFNDNSAGPGGNSGMLGTHGQPQSPQPSPKLEMKAFIDKVLTPISAEIARMSR